MSYLQATKKEIVTDVCVDNQYKHGWTYFSKKTRKILYQSTNLDILDDQELTSNQIIKIYKNMSDYWNYYRDEINNLLGDISPYYNYKMDLYNIELEENMFNDDIIASNDKDKDKDKDKDNENNIEYF